MTENNREKGPSQTWFTRMSATAHVGACA